MTNLLNYDKKTAIAGIQHGTVWSESYALTRACSKLSRVSLGLVVRTPVAWR